MYYHIMISEFDKEQVERVTKMNRSEREDANLAEIRDELVNSVEDLKTYLFKLKEYKPQLS